MTVVHFVVPEGIEDPRRPSGGNHYGLRVVEELRRSGRDVRLVHDAAQVPDGALTLVDGLLAEATAGHGDRLRVVLLLHMPYDGPLLATARGVVATSAWTAGRLDVPAHVARPGVDPAPLARWSGGGGRLLCIGAVVPDKGHDVLLEAMTKLDDLAWRLTCVGSLDRDAAWVNTLRRDPRVVFAGPRVRAELAARYAASDLLILPTRRESYGMVVTEAQARGMPVVASDVGGVREALGGECPESGPERGPDIGGLLVRPDDPGALADALRQWLENDWLRESLRDRSRARRETLTGWDVTAREIAGVLDEVAR